MIAILNQQLADTFDLYGQTKQAHGNVKGAQFFPLHELFDQRAAELEHHVDAIAERAMAFGKIALGTVRISAANSKLPEYELELTDSLPTVEALTARYAALAASVGQAIELAQARGDANTTELFTDEWTRLSGFWRRTSEHRAYRLGHNARGPVVSSFGCSAKLFREFETKVVRTCKKKENLRA